MKLAGRIGWNAVSAWTSQVTRAVVALYVTAVLIAALGRSGLGLIAVLLSMMSIAQMFDMGLHRGMSRHLAAAIATNERERIRIVFSSGMACYAGFGLLVVSVFAFGGPWIAGFLTISPEYQQQMLVLVRVVPGTMILLTVITSVFTSVLIGENRFDLIAYFKIVESLLRGVTVYLLVGRYGLGAYGWATAAIGAMVVNLALTVIWARFLCGDLRFRFRWVRFDTLGELLSLGGGMLLYQIANGLPIRANPLILAALMSETAAGLYQPALQLVMAAVPVVYTLSRQLYPVATKFYARGQMGEMRELLTVGTRYTVLIMVPISAVLICFATPILEAWLGNQLAPDTGVTAATLVLLSIVSLVNLAIGPQWETLIGMNRVRFAVTVTTVSAIINVVASVLLVWWLYASGWGMLSVVGVAAPELVCLLARRAILTVHVTRALEMSTAGYVRDAYLRPLVVFTALLCLGAAVRFVVRPESLVALLFAVAVVSAAWVPLVWWVAFGETDRNRFAGLLRGAAARIGVRRSSG